MPTLFGTLPFLVLRTVFWWASEYLDPPYQPYPLVGLGVPRPTLLTDHTPRCRNRITTRESFGLGFRNIRESGRATGRTSVRCNPARRMASLDPHKHPANPHKRPANRRRHPDSRLTSTRIQITPIPPTFDS
jgi:hypothetical protein